MPRLAALLALAVAAAPLGAQPSPPATDTLYAPARTYTASEPVTFTVESPGRVGGDRSVPVAMRWPVGAEGPRPVVVWSHGGSDGKADALASGPAWGEALAEAGYVVLSVAHPPRDAAGTEALCDHVGYPDLAACIGPFRTVRWDRPLDLSAVLDWVDAAVATPRWAARLDPARLAVAGYSAGSTGAAQLAGMVRTEGPDSLVARTDPRPIAFLMLAPQGPSLGDHSGIADDAWAAIDRPVFGATGLGDVTAGDDPDNRALAFQGDGGIDAEGSRLIWLDDPAAAHSLFNLEPAACRRSATAAHCDALLDVLRTTALAFLDAHVLGRAEALDWLAEADLPAVTDGLARWEAE